MSILDQFQGEQEQGMVPTVNTAPSPECLNCGLYAACKRPLVAPTEDQRMHINGKTPKAFPLVMVVGPKMDFENDNLGEALSEGTFVGSMLLDYLSILEARWVYVPILRCATQKASKKALDTCQVFLAREIAHYKPDAILALGKDAFERLWPEGLGKAPSLFKARTMPVKMDSGRWLLGSYDPNSHRHYLESEGARGQDLSVEYPMTFRLLDQLFSGTYSQDKLHWKRIQTQDELDFLVTSLNSRGVKTVCIDMEDDTFCAHDNQWRPYKLQTPGLPGKYTRWHPDNRLLDFGLCALVDDAGGKLTLENYAINVELLRGHPGNPNFNVHRLLHGRTLVGWNIKVEVQDVWLFTGYDMIAPENHNPLVDGILMRSLRDQSLVHNSLKATAQEVFGIPDWSHTIWQELDQVKKSNPWGTGSMGEVNASIREEYNIGDVYWNMRLVYEHLVPGKNFPQVAYDNLMAGLPWVCRMERNGLPFRPDIAHAVLGVYERELVRHTQILKNLPEFQEACVRSGCKPEDWSPKKKKFWAEFLDLFGLKGQVGTTPTGQLVQDAHTVREFGGEGDSAGVGLVPWAQKNYAQKVFTVWHRITRYGDDAGKYRYYLDYVVPSGSLPGHPAAQSPYGVIHQDYYMVKAEVESLGNNTNTMEFAGAKSGRFSRTPPQNANNDPIFLSPYEVEPGWLIVEFDYSQAELVWIARNCEDELLMQWIREGADLHLRKGARLFTYRTKRPESDFWAWRSEQDCKVMGGASPEQKPWRQMGKTDNFAFAFLQEPETISHALGITLEEAYEIGRASDLMHPNIRAKKIETYEKLNRGETVSSHLFQRRRSCPLWTASRMDGAAFFSWDRETRKKRNSQNLNLFRSLWNTIIAQADSSDMTFAMGGKIDRKIQGGLLKKDQVLPIDFVHDALKFKIRESYLDTAVPVISREMMDFSEFPIPFDLPISVEVKAGRSMAKMEKIRL